MYVQVPTAIKAMYSGPLKDTLNAPTLTQLLVTAVEELETLRKEETLQRQTAVKEMIPPPTATTNSDKVPGDDSVSC